MRCFCIWLLIDCLWFLQTAQLKQFQEQQQKSKEFSSPSSSSSMGTQSPAPPPQQPPKESFARRYKFLWPMLLAVNLAVGGPFLSLIPQLCEFFFFPLQFLMYFCVNGYLFVYEVISRILACIKWCHGFLYFSLKEWCLRLLSAFLLDVVVDGYSVVRMGDGILISFSVDFLTDASLILNKINWHVWTMYGERD